MGHILGPKSHVSLSSLSRLFLAMTKEILDRECGPIGPIFAISAILGEFGNTISPWGKETSQREVMCLVADDPGQLP